MPLKEIISLHEANEKFPCQFPTLSNLFALFACFLCCSYEIHHTKNECYWSTDGHVAQTGPTRMNSMVGEKVFLSPTHSPCMFVCAHACACLCVSLARKLVSPTDMGLYLLIMTNDSSSARQTLRTAEQRGRPSVCHDTAETLCTRAGARPPLDF